jgi:myo-inositol-1(or 4)-monophosphatase
MNLDELLECALEAANIGAAELQKHFRGPLQIDTKTSAADYVTNADLASETAVRAAIRDRRPNDAITGEEFAAQAGTNAEFYWSIDPLDGTVNFTRGFPNWATSVGVKSLVTGEWLAGAVVAPALGLTYFAKRGGGAWVIRGENKAKLHGPDASREAKIIATGFSYSADERVEQFQKLQSLMVDYVDVRRIGAAALDMCWVAEGSIDAYYEAGIKEYDWAAAMVIAEEAGLQVHRPEFARDPAIVARDVSRFNERLQE